MSAKAASRIVGQLTPEERDEIRRRDLLVEQYRKEINPERRLELLASIEASVARYDRMRRARWEKGEVN